MEVEECEKHSQLDKWIIAIILGFVFLIISSYQAYNVTNNFGSYIGIKTMKNGTPNKIGYLVHLLIFILFIRILLK